jgi:hypothetical protein
MDTNRYYYKYLFCSTAYVCTSTDAFGSFRIIPVLFFIVYLAYVFVSNTKSLKQSVIDTRLVGLFVLLLVVGVVRHNLPNFTNAMVIHRVLSLGIYYLATSHIIRNLLRAGSAVRVINVLLVPFFFLAGLNILFFLVGITREVIVAKDTSVLMAAIGISDFSRINFYLVGGVNSYGALNGLCLVVAGLSWIFKIHTRKSALLFFAVFLIIAFFTDSRGALVFAVLSIMAAFFYVRKKRFLLLKLSPYLAFFAPFLMFLIFPILAQSDFFSNLSRSDNDLATGNSRFLIWAIIFNDLVNNSSASLFGYGDGGLYLLPSFRFIADLFANYEDIVINSQNTMLTLLLDFGFATLSLFLVILFKHVSIITKFFNKNPLLLIVLSAMIFYVLLIGITEAIIGMYYQNAFVVFIYILCLPFLIKQNSITKSAL